jgi:alpha-beta hydrolase superfamily lysophospholipase
MRPALALAAAIGLAIAAPAWAGSEEGPSGAPPDETGVRLPTRPGVTETFLFDAPADPKAVVILFMGGEGAIGIAGEGPHPALRYWGNFLIRSRGKFVAAGLATIALDAPSDSSGGIDEAFRKGAEHAADVGAVVAWVRQKVKAPVWLIGTSMGSISAASVAIRLGNAVDGLVLTSSVSAGGRNSPAAGVSTLDLDKVAVPALVMDHVNDGCKSSPPGNADIIAKDMTKSPRVAVKMIEGGDTPKSGPCEAFSYHGYYGVEDKAVDAIAAFILEK